MYQAGRFPGDMGTEKVLIIGSGGREHAIAHALHQSPVVGEIFVAPGNAGTEKFAKNVDIAAEDVNGLVSFAHDAHIDLTVVGPEAPLSCGVVDAFTEANLPIFGPTQKAARLETSKVFSSEFMERNYIPHPTFYTVRTVDEARTIILQKGAANIVIKADGLALGKGVILPNSDEEALAVVQEMMVEKTFGEAGTTVLFQERLEGPEVSVLAISDGIHVIPLLPARDRKRLLDGDRGPNTGGMGAYAPVPDVTQELLEEIHRTILQPTIDGMREEGMPYRGVLYAGLMITPSGPKVLEYNCRFGDPETQPLMMLMRSDLAPFLSSAAIGSLEKRAMWFYEGYAVCVVLASDGYPGPYEKGREIHSDWPEDSSIVVFHAGTMVKDGKLVTNGGRVLGITAYGKTLEQATQRAYKYIEKGSVYFDGMQYRTDIGKEK